MRKHIILSDVKRAVCNRNFIIGMMGMMLVIALSSLESIIYMARSPDPLQSGYHKQFVLDALLSDWVTLSLPIICELPFTTALSASFFDFSSNLTQSEVNTSGRLSNRPFRFLLNKFVILDFLNPNAVPRRRCGANIERATPVRFAAGRLCPPRMSNLSR